MIPWHWYKHANFWLVLCASGAAAGSYWLAQHYLSRQAQVARAEVAKAWITREVVVAASDLPQGARLVPTALARRAVPVRYLASDALAADFVGQALGQRLLRPLHAGEVLSRSALASASAMTLATLVEPGERALTIPVDESAGAAGLLAPGDFVDLLCVLREDAGSASRAGPRVQPLLQGVQVLATGHATRAHASAGDYGAEGESSYATITLRLRPEDAQRVLLAQKLGDLSVAVRPAGDQQAAALVEIGREALWPAAARPPGQRRASSVEYIIGGTGSGPATTTRAAAGVQS